MGNATFLQCSRSFTGNFNKSALMQSLIKKQLRKSLLHSVLSEQPQTPAVLSLEYTSALRSLLLLLYTPVCSLSFGHIKNVAFLNIRFLIDTFLRLLWHVLG